MVTKQESQAKLPLVVVKLSTKTLMTDKNELRRDVIESLALQIHQLRDKYRFILVTSGAIGKGREVYADLRKLYDTDDVDPETRLLFEQMCASEGQPDLMTEYKKALGIHDLRRNQVLVEHEHFEDQSRRHALRASLEFMLKPEHRNVVIVNENDVVCSDEIKKVRESKDNDLIGANVAQLMEATHFLVLTKLNGIKENVDDPDSNTIPRIQAEGDEILACIKKGAGEGSRGGADSKITNSKKAARQGIHVEILSFVNDFLERILINHERLGTVIANGAVDNH